MGRPSRAKMAPCTSSTTSIARTADSKLCWASNPWRPTPLPKSDPPRVDVYEIGACVKADPPAAEGARIACKPAGRKSAEPHIDGPPLEMHGVHSHPL